MSTCGSAVTVVQNDVRRLERRGRLPAAGLAGQVASLVAPPDVLLAAEVCVPPHGPGEGHRLRDVQVHRQVPACSKLGPEQEDAVDDQDRMRGDGLQRHHLAVGPVVEARRSYVLRPRCEGFQALASECVVVERVEVVALGRLVASAQPDLSGVVPPVDGGTDGRPPQAADEIVGERRLACSIWSIDADDGSPTDQQPLDEVGQPLHGATVGVPLEPCTEYAPAHVLCIPSMLQR